MQCELWKTLTREEDRRRHITQQIDSVSSAADLLSQFEIRKNETATTMISQNAAPDNATPDNATPDNATPDNATSTISFSRKGMLDNSHDIRSLIWSLAFFPLMPVLAVFSPQLSLYLWPVALYLGFSAGVLSHYHNHRGVFRKAWLNQSYSVWLSVFYGFPIFSWIPTHNQNHHKYVNGEKDATRTSRMGRADSLFAASLYPLQSSAWQLPALVAYVRKLRKKKTRMFVWAVAQACIVVAAHACFWGAAVAHNGLSHGSLSYGLLVAMPALFASWAMMFINYVQHVGCHADSEDNHSRNFVGSWENWLVFDAGLHTVHHENPGAHWSEYRELHRARAENIDVSLCKRNVLTFVVERYLLGRKDESEYLKPTSRRIGYGAS